MNIGDAVYIGDKKKVFGRVLKFSEGGGIAYIMTPAGSIIKSGLLWITQIRKREEWKELSRFEEIGDPDGFIYENNKELVSKMFDDDRRYGI